MRLHVRSILLVMALCVCSASLALGASVTIISSGGGSFVVQGDNMTGVSGIDLTIGYDTSVLASPSVNWGGLISGALPLANTTVPGNIRIAIIRVQPFSGSGPVASISFGTHKASGGITSISAKLTDSKGGNMPVQASIVAEKANTASDTPGIITTAGVPFSQPAATRDSSTVTTTTTTQAPAGLGTVSMPGDTQPKAEVPPVESKTARAPETAEAVETATPEMKQQTVEKAAETSEPANVKQTVYGSVLDRFRTYQGERTPEALVALFAKPLSPFIRQEPEVVISDGKATVRVMVDLSAIKGTSTNFALSGARLVSLKGGEGTDTWALESLPQANSLKATVTIMNSNSVIEFPLTVVPPATVVSAKQADFAAFLKDSAANIPKYDLNGDGRHDYLDDFIYTAYYILNSTAAAKNSK